MSVVYHREGLKFMIGLPKEVTELHGAQAFRVGDSVRVFVATDQGVYSIDPNQENPEWRKEGENDLQTQAIRETVSETR